MDYHGHSGYFFPGSNVYEGARPLSVGWASGEGAGRPRERIFRMRPMARSKSPTAMYNEGTLSPNLQSRLDRAISEGKLISVRSLCSPFSAEPEKAYLSYAESYSLVEYLLHDYGQEKMLELLTLLKDGESYDQALTDVYGFDIDGLDARWRATLLNTGAATAIQLPEFKEGKTPQIHSIWATVSSILTSPESLMGALISGGWIWHALRETR